MFYLIELCCLVLKNPSVDVDSLIVTVTKPLVISVIKISSANIFLFSSSILLLLRLKSSFRLFLDEEVVVSFTSSSDAIILFKLCFLIVKRFLGNDGNKSSFEHSLSLLLSNWLVLSLFKLLFAHNLCFLWFFDNIDEFEDVVENFLLLIFSLFICLIGALIPIGLRPSAIRFAQRNSSFLSFIVSFTGVSATILFCSFVDDVINVSVSSFVFLDSFK